VNLKLLTHISLRKSFKKKSDDFSNRAIRVIFFYIIQKGIASIWSSPTGKNQQKNSHDREGELFRGEMALIFGDMRNSTVIAETDIETFSLFKNDFNAAAAR